MNKNFSIERVLLIGASGYIGKHVLRALIKNGMKVICVYRNPPCKGDELQIGTDNLITFILNINNDVEFHEFTETCPAFDAVITCIGSRTGGIQDSWDSEYLANLNVLRLAKRRSAKKFIYLSAICVQKPRLHFQKAKLAMENELINSGMPYTIIRPTAFFKSLAGQIKRVKLGKSFIIFDNGKGTACKPISELDLAEFIFSSLNSKEMTNKILPIGGASPAFTSRALGDLVFEIAGKTPRFTKLPSDLFKILQIALTPLACFSKNIANKIEFLRIAHYYATESMLIWDNKVMKYSSEKTPEFGSISLEAFYRESVIKGLKEQDLGNHKLF